MKSNLVSRWVRAGLLTAVVDGLFSNILVSVAYHSTASRLFQGVAAVVLGEEAFSGGAATVALGLVMHFAVAFGWSAVFIFVVLRWPWMRGVVTAPYGVVKAASLYGPLVWMVMSLIVIPALTHRPPTISFRWWVQFFGHIPFVGVPIVASSVGAGSRGRR